MPVVTFQAPDLCRLIGRDLAVEKLAQRMPMMGGDLDRVEGQAITIEWFPNRPDLLVVEGTGRALRAFLDVKPGLPSYEVRPARTTLMVDPSVAKLRPFAALCFVRGVPFDEDYVRQVVDAQEKLTHSPGRRRRKVAIGIHDASGLEGPFTYTTVDPGDKAFVPLGGTQAQTPRDILRTHPKGQEYGHLIPGRCPVFLDGRGEVVSMPPVINAQRTAVTARTRDVLVDVTGTDVRAVRQTVALLATCLAERGGAIEAVTVHDASGTWTSPDLKPSEHVLHLDDVRALLGLEWSAEHAAACLERMGHGAQAFGNKLLVQVGAWRSDILHPVDLMEDVGIGHGFDQFAGELPAAMTFGGTLATRRMEERLRTILLGLGWSEAKTLTLSNPHDQWGAWGAAAQPAVTLLNPVLEEQTLLRTRLAPSLLRVLAANRHRNLPQRLFEIGHVVQRDANGTWRNRLALACVELSARAGLSEAKGLAEAVLRDAGLPLRIAPGSLPGLVAGRQGDLVGPSDKVTGHFGELHPDTLIAFGLGAPGFMLELALDS